MENIARTDVKKIIRQIKRNQIGVMDIPEEYKNDIEIVTFERKAGLRITGKRGFDVITTSFFVEEDLIYHDLNDKEQRKGIFLTFDNFDEYYYFLNGDIYDNACYTFCDLKKYITTAYEIDLQKLLERKAFVDNTIDSYTLSATDDEIVEYENAKQTHEQCQEWINRFNSCKNYVEFIKVKEEYCISEIAMSVDLTFFFFQYIFADIKDKDRFNVIMKYMSSGVYPEHKLINALCIIYNADEVMESYNYSLGVQGTIYKHKKKLKDYIKLLEDGKINFNSRAFFDKKTHYFCEEINGYAKENSFFPIVTIHRYFESFDEFIRYRNGDLTNCDLSGALECKKDFSKYIIDETTVLPCYINEEMVYLVKKYYKDGKFYVIQQWLNKYNKIVKKYKHSFDYFFDFVAFLRCDLSKADLILCDGLDNLNNCDSIDFTDARLQSKLCDKFGIKYSTYKIDLNSIKSFVNTEKNESETEIDFQNSRDIMPENSIFDLSSTDFIFNVQRVCYISDIHLMHRIKTAGCRSKEDIVYVMKKIANSIANDAGRLLLIDGDVASNFDIFQLFVNVLSVTLPQNTVVVFTLGNHELWDFQGYKIDEIVSKYRQVLEEHGMYLLHNDLMYGEDCSLFDNPKDATHMIKYDDICNMGETQLSNCLRKARYIILGGLGFSGYNTNFNAENGIYRNVVDRKTEINESKIFEELYNRLYPIISKKNTIVLTHTPKMDWCCEEKPDKKVVYVSGHTHRNFFYDDGEYRVYADNQIGYHNDRVQIKSFLIDNDYDCFCDYKDGIYKISNEQYKEFYRGKNISMTFSRDINVLYMLKKDGYYCFIHKSKGGSLTILNGGAMKKINIKDINYYYDNMDVMISTIKKPLDKFSLFQKRVSDIVKKIGGTGIIHGCIIDIDYYNHIYVNPIDLSLTGYFAFDIINKIVYPSIPDLLKDKCPELYDRYENLIEGKKGNPLIVKKKKPVTTLPQDYLNTDIYIASREIKKMQKLSSNILSYWNESIINAKKQIERA